MKEMITESFQTCLDMERCASISIVINSEELSLMGAHKFEYPIDFVPVAQYNEHGAHIMERDNA